MDSFTWKITGRTASGFCFGNEPPDNWRDQLATRLGHRPRRIGILAELAVFGALDCIDAAGEATLPTDAVVQVCSLRGSFSAISQVLEQNRTGLPMPFSFLQSQTSQILPALAAALNWQGDAGIVIVRNAMDMAILACHQAGDRGMLLGWVEEPEPARSAWLRLVPSAPQLAGFIPAASFIEMVAPNTHYWRLSQGRVEIAPGPD